jgi:UDP-GlcNAc:undecaprenyl-phosphate GlcNAc-1-phosphate transferase
MITSLQAIFQAILITTSMAVVLSPVAIAASKRIGLVDRPGSAMHKKHAVTTPITGGILLAASLAVIGLTDLVELSATVKGILSGTFLMILIGLIDDFIDLPPAYKFFGQIVATTAIVLFGIQVHITRIIWLDLAVTYLWLVGISNALNFVDSMDGLAVGLAGITSAYFMLVTVDAAQPELAILAGSILGTMIGAYVYSAPPAKMFLGDSGAQALGVSLAAIGIAYTPGQAGLPQGATWFAPILALGVPVFDTVLVIFSRLKRSTPIYEANTDHLYHRLVMMGFNPIRAVAIMQLAAIILSIIAFLAIEADVVSANIIFASIILFGLIAVFYLERRYQLYFQRISHVEEGHADSGSKLTG